LPESFDITTNDGRGKTILLRLAGRLDAKSAPTLMQRCGDVRASGNNLILNMEAVSFVASSGIGALLALAEQFKETNTDVRIAAPSAAVESVINLLNLDQFLHVDPTEEQAFTALEG
jgi:anti-anti-sigma factor